jgi:hypothetical protein
MVIPNVGTLFFFCSVGTGSKVIDGAQVAGYAHGAVARAHPGPTGRHALAIAGLGAML